MILDIFGLWWEKSEIFADYNLFLFGIAIFWLLVASIQDLRKREVENWWNFSLVIFALAFKAFLSIEKGNVMYLVWGLIGLGVGFVLANAFYYGRMFAGGDAKLLMGLCIVLMPSLDWSQNALFLVSFLAIFLMVGSIYGLVFSFALMFTQLSNFKKAFLKNFKEYRITAYIFQIVGFLVFIIFMNSNFTLTLFGAIIFLAPILLLFAKAIEESAMTKMVSVKELTIGDWLVQSIKIKIGKKIHLIKPDWQGLSESELKLIQTKLKGKKILVKNGVPFVPAFFMGFVLLLLGILFSIV